MARNVSKNNFTVNTNRKAFHNYHISDTYEAGLELLGSEVKSLREKEVSIEQAFIKIENSQGYIYNMYVKPYKFNTHGEIDPVRPRRLLLNRQEINKLGGASAIKGNAVVPLELFFKNGWAKLKIGLAKGKQNFDKREDIKKRDLNREMEQSFKNKIRF